MTDKTKLVAESPMLPWWTDDQQLPSFYPTGTQRKTACERHAPLYSLIVYIILNGGVYPLIYLNDTDPMEWHFLVYYVCLGVCLICAIALGIVDPGIRAPNLHGALRDGNTDWVVQNFGPPPEHMLQDDIQDLVAEEYRVGQKAVKKVIDGVEHKWCFTCKLWRPPGTVHCSECGFCVDHYDHHCGVIGHCVAKKNLRFFAGMLLCAGVASVAMLVACIFRAMDLQGSGKDVWGDWNWYVTLACCMYCACLGLSFLPMGVAYFGVMFTAETMDKRMSGEGDNSPLKKCSCKTFGTICCAPLCNGVHRSSHPFGAGRGYYGCQ